MNASITAARIGLLCILIFLPARQVLAEPPSTPDFSGIPVDPYGQYPAYKCLTADPHRAGVEQFSYMVLVEYPGTSSGDAWAPCDTHSAFSLHHAGRAWDWFVTQPGNQATASEAQAAEELINWLLETVDGVPHMRLRRLGIVEIIWFDRIWTTQSRAWTPYTFFGCPDPNVSNTTCHRDHVHFGFSIEGANGHTSWWLGFLGWLLATLGQLLRSLAL